VIDPRDELRALLRAMRKRSGKKPAEIIQHMGISRPCLYWWEGPHTRIDVADLQELLKLYGCTEVEISAAIKLRSHIKSSRSGLEDRPTEPDLTPVP